MKRTALSGVVVLLLAVGACADTAPERLLAPEAVAATAHTPPPSLNGALVTFDQMYVYFFHFDEQRGLLSVHGGGLFCGGSPPNIGDRQIVTTPSEIEQTLVKVQDGDSHVAVYRASSLNDAFPDLCGFLNGPNKVAEGVVRHTQTFTAASFAAHWGGTVQAVDGGELHLSESYQLTADAHDPNNPATWSLNASHVILSPRR